MSQSNANIIDRMHETWREQSRAAFRDAVLDEQWKLAAQITWRAAKDEAACLRGVSESVEYRARIQADRNNIARKWDKRRAVCEAIADGKLTWAPSPTSSVIGTLDDMAAALDTVAA